MLGETRPRRRPAECPPRPLSSRRLMRPQSVAGRRPAHRSGRCTTSPRDCAPAAARRARAVRAEGISLRSAADLKRRPRSACSCNDLNPTTAPPMAPVTYTSSPGRAPARVSTRRGLTDPIAVTSIISGPGDRVMLPPTIATRCRAASAEQSVDDAIDDSDSSCVWQHEREQRGARLGAHRREVAEVDGQRPMPDGVVAARIADRNARLQPVRRWSARRARRAPARITAASSPGPTRTQDGVARRAVMRAMSACSPMSETVRLLTVHRTRAVGA